MKNIFQRICLARDLPNQELFIVKTIIDLVNFGVNTLSNHTRILEQSVV